jgi:hypothetical protein
MEVLMLWLLCYVDVFVRVSSTMVISQFMHFILNAIEEYIPLLHFSSDFYMVMNR